MAESTDALDKFLDANLLYSQDAFVFSDHKHLMGLGAVGSGKSLALCRRAMVLSLIHPGNEGMIGRAYGPELETTTMAQFFEYCDPDLIDNFQKKDRRLRLRTIGKKKSEILFRHIIEPNPTRKHLSSANWGWFAIDQAEDTEPHHWQDLMGRLRRPDVGKQTGCGVANPKGHDWIWQRWIKPAEDKGKIDIHMVPGKGRPAKVELYYPAADHLCVKTESAENTFLPDGYIENLIEHNTDEWVQRYVMGSTDEWSGRIYKEFSARSPHVIDPFEIPRDWDTIVAMDAGGVDPWAVVVLRVDPVRGDVILTNEFYEQTTLLRTIADWIKNPQHSGIPDWQRATYVQDPENAQTVFEFNDVHDLPVNAAQRGGATKKPGIYRVSGYMHRIKGRERTFPGQGAKHPGSEDPGTIYDAPYFWVFNTCPNTINDLEEYHWDYDQRSHKSKEEPVKDGFHLCDAVRYGFQEVPSVQEAIEGDDEYQEKLQKMREHDFFSFQAQLNAQRVRSTAMHNPNKEPSLSEAWADEVLQQGAVLNPDEEPGILQW